ncbi:MAG TPA: cation:dicarboxylase symporter family transporter, partial [Gemmatimonadaceae bacterium]
LAFIAGLGGGKILPQFAGAVGPLGTVWVKAISALVVPLVVALLISGVTSLADARAAGRLGVRALVVFLALLAGGATLVALVTPSLLTFLGVTHASAGTLGSATVAIAAAKAAPGFWEWIAALIPTNPVKAAADGMLLPLVIFTVAFAVATMRLSSEPRAYIVGLFRGVAAAMIELVRWVLWIAPAGVFSLAYALGARTGLGSAHALVALVILVAATCFVYMCALYALAALLGGVPLIRFARAIARAQVIGFSSRFSLAALPAMIEAGETQLALPPAVTGFVLPLAVSTFKLGATIAIITSTLFLARMYGVAITPAQLTSITVSAVLLSFSVPGIPAGVLLVMVPVLTSIGIPAEGIGILFAMDVIPDMVRTLTNVTADMVAAVIVARSMRDTRG